MEGDIQNNGRQHYNANVDYDDDEQVSDCESCLSIEDNYRELYIDPSLIRLEEDNNIRNVFLSCLGQIRERTSIVAIHKKNWSSSRTGSARLLGFDIFLRASRNHMNSSRDYNSQMEFAWYCCSKEDVVRIMTHGFGHHDITCAIGSYGHGVRLLPNLSIQSVKSCVEDDDGIRHVLRCRVLLEEEDTVHGRTKQSGSRSGNANSEIASDNFTTMYVVNSTKMNTHIVPEYVISFRTSSLDGFSKTETIKSMKPNSPWIPMPALILALSKVLPPREINKIIKLYKNYKDRRISRLDLVERLRHLVGTDLLVEVIKNMGNANERTLPTLEAFGKAHLSSTRGKGK